MNNRTPRFVEHLKACGTRCEGQICVFVIGRRVTLVKTSDPVQHLALHVEASSRAVIDLAQLVEFRVPLILILTVSAGAAVPEYLAARFLQTSVAVY